MGFLRTAGRCAAVVGLALAAYGPVHAATIAVMDGDHNVINGTLGGHLGLNGLGHTSTLFADTAGGWSSALASGADVLLIEQNGEDGATVADVSAYLNGGGRVIMLGGSGSAFYNALFGTSTSFDSRPADLEVFARQAAAAGTTFADDAASIVGLSSHHEATSGLAGDATVYYGGPGNAIVFRQVVGSGDFFYLGWDYCCGGNASQANDWYGVLDSAINFASPAAPAPEPGSIALLALGVAGLAVRRRRAGR